MGIEAAIIGSAIAGAGASAISARQQSRAVDRASQAQQQATDQATALNREIFNTQTRLAEPFRQFGIRQAGALSDLVGLGFDQSQFLPGAQAGGMGAQPASANPNAAMNAYYANNPDVAREFSRVAPGGFGPNLPASYDANRDGRLGADEFMQFRADRFDGNEGGRGNPLLAGMTSGSNMMGSGQVGQIAPPASNPGQPVSAPIPASQTAGGAGTGQTAIQQGQDRARERFQGSLFDDALQGALGRAATGVDANFAAAGNVYSGARQQAQQNTAADLGMSALGMYTNTLLGQPSTAGAQMASNAAGQFGANQTNLALQSGQNAANSAFQQGQIGANLTGNLANLASFGIGAFPWGGGGSKPVAGSGGGSFNFGYQPGMFVQ